MPKSTRDQAVVFGDRILVSGSNKNVDMEGFVCEANFYLDTGWIITMYERYFGATVLWIQSLHGGEVTVLDESKRDESKPYDASWKEISRERPLMMDDRVKISKAACFVGDIIGRIRRVHLDYAGYTIDLKNDRDGKSYFWHQPTDGGRIERVP